MEKHCGAIHANAETYLKDWLQPNVNFVVYDLTDKKVFPKYDVLGWYSTGSDIQDSDILIHKAVSLLLQ
jgi:hypothetical protein